MKLTDIPVVFICPDHNDKYRERKEHVFRLLTSLGFKDVLMFQSGNEEYPKCLSKATHDILSARLDDLPFLLLEDDIELTEWAHVDMEIEVPENTDAFYLGFSKYAGSFDGNWSMGIDTYQIETISDRYIKIINMLGTHAILYITKRYKEAVLKTLEFSIKENMYSDIPISRQQPQYNVYAYKYPFFFQSDKLGNGWATKYATNFRV